MRSPSTAASARLRSRRRRGGRRETIPGDVAGGARVLRGVAAVDGGADVRDEFGDERGDDARGGGMGAEVGDDGFESG